MSQELIHKIALTLIPKIGDVLAKNLVAYCGSAEAVFKEKKAHLLKIPGIGEMGADSILKKDVFERAEKEILFIEKHKIEALFYLDEKYPLRLKICSDSPTMLYYRGNADLNATKIISVVGTRNATTYGKQICEKLIKDLTNENILIVSGLAYGIDICAHKASLANGLQTVGVLAHGLDKIYPAVHQNTAREMVEQGGLLTEFLSETNPDKENFPTRNRIVAGMADATIVVESKKEGGSLITAEIANSYNRDVFAFPGRVGDASSEGCHKLIKQNKAALIESAADLIYLMSWEKTTQKEPKQTELFVDLTPEEEIIVSFLKEKNGVNIDDLCIGIQMPVYKVSSLLLNLEFSGLVKSMPGKMYSLN